jgi:hypothetical protein
MTTTNQIAISSEATRVIALVRNAVKTSPTGVSFFSIKNYTNKFGEVSNQLINVGINYEKSKQSDITMLNSLDETKMTWKSAMVDIVKAKIALIEAFIKPDENRSNGQTDAYTTIVSGVRVHNDTGKLYIYGYRVSKKVIVEGEYPIVKSSNMTIAKNELRKLCKTDKFVNFGIAIGNSVSAKGETIEL